MISNITYYSFKDINLRHKIPHIGLFIIVLTLSFISFDPPMVLLTFFALYALSGPILLLVRMIRKRSNNKTEKRPSASQ